MLKPSLLPQPPQSRQLARGDCVRYIGTNLKVQQDYGDQELRVLAIDRISGITICENQTGGRLVGVSYSDLESITCHT